MVFFCVEIYSFKRVELVGLNAHMLTARNYRFRFWQMFAELRVEHRYPTNARGSKSNVSEMFGNVSAEEKHVFRGCSRWWRSKEQNKKSGLKRGLCAKYEGKLAALLLWIVASD